MKIGLDAFAAIGRGGNSRYSRELIAHVLREQNTNQYFLFGYLHDWGRKTLFEKGPNHRECNTQLSATYFPLPNLPNINEWLLRHAAQSNGVEVMHFTNPLSVVKGPYKRVVTIHDLAPLHNRAWTKAGPGELFRQKAELMVTSDAIIAVSHATKQDIVGRFGVDARKITVVYEGAGQDFYADDDEAAVEALVGKGPYVLCVGQLQPRKNNIGLIGGFGAVARNFPELRLVFAGRPVSDEYKELLQQAVRSAGVEGRVVFVHDADDAALRKLYTRAEVLVYPSLFEGFGLPVLESLQCGVPAIVSNVSSLPEVAGEAGLLVDPHSTESIAGGIERYMSDTALRTRLRAAIPAQLQKFSWQKAAQETLKVYASLA